MEIVRNQSVRVGVIEWGNYNNVIYKISISIMANKESEFLELFKTLKCGTKVQ